MPFCFLVTAHMSNAEDSEPKRNKETTRSTSDCLQWAISEGISEHLRLTDAQNQENVGKLYCILCAIWLSTKGAILKDHVLGKTVKQADGSKVRKPGGHAAKVAKVPVQPPAPTPEPVCSQPPTIVVYVTTPDKADVANYSPPPKKQKTSGASVLESMLHKGMEEQTFHRDLATAFTTCNIPLEKLHPHAII